MRKRILRPITNPNAFISFSFLWAADSVVCPLSDDIDHHYNGQREDSSEL